jgi:hypothetical protein
MGNVVERVQEGRNEGFADGGVDELWNGSIIVSEEKEERREEDVRLRGKVQARCTTHPIIPRRPSTITASYTK